MHKVYTLFFFLHFFCNAFPQQIKLLKSTVGSGGISINHCGGISLSHTIGQSSLINGFNAASTLLLQGFQHPFLYNQNTEISTTRFLVYPNPSKGKVSMLLQGEGVIEQLNISLFDLQGKLVDNVFRLRDGNKIELDFTKVVNGVYELIVQGEKTGAFKTLIYIN